jgi:hypothetical protein
MEKPNLDNLPKEVQEYIEWADGALKGTSRLLTELNLISDGISDDLKMIRKGEAGADGDNLKYIKPDKNDVLFNRLMVILDKHEDLMKIEKASKALFSQVIITETNTANKEHRNPFEETSDKVKKKLQG